VSEPNGSAVEEPGGGAVAGEPGGDAVAGEPAWFETVASRTVHRGFSTVRVDTVRTPDGHEVEREVVERPAAVAVVPLTDDDRILLLRQYRQPFGRYLLEVPAGLLDQEGETPEAAARRELIEELHHDVRGLEHLATIETSAGWSTERTHIYLGRGLTTAAPPQGWVPEAEEAHLEVVALLVDDALELARVGEITDAKTLIGILLTGARLGR
jgi:8-oxo-dGDP phosphatase